MLKVKGLLPAVKFGNGEAGDLDVLHPRTCQSRDVLAGPYARPCQMLEVWEDSEKAVGESSDDISVESEGVANGIEGVGRVGVMFKNLDSPGNRFKSCPVQLTK